MFSSRPVLALLLGIFLTPSLHAESLPVQTDDQALIDETDYNSFRLEGAEAEKVTFSIQEIDALGYKSSLLLKSSVACSTPYSAQIDQHNRKPIQKGDVILVHFYLRTLQSSLESGEGLTELVIEDSKSFTKTLQFGASALKEWREYTIPFVANADYSIGQAAVIFRLGYQPQTIELAGLTIKDLGTKENLADLPTGLAKLHYAGQESDAPWRAAAERRIDKIRKADLTIQVVDGSDQPVRNAELTVQQTAHAYWFGSAVRTDHILQGDNPEEQDRYRAALKEMFNVVTFENELKWPFWMRDLNRTLASAKWLSENGIALRGHALVWASHAKGLPESLYPLLEQPDQLREAILSHIRDVTSQLQPKAAAWDVLNEPFNNHEFMDVLGRDAMATWFQEAHKGSPQSRLFINDWGIVTSRGMDKTHQDDYEKTIAYLIDNKAPLDGIGIQGHFGREATAPENMYDVLNRFGKFGKEIQMTEYSSQFSDPKDAASYLRDCMTVFFSQESTTGFILWGFREGIGMENKSFLYDKNWKLTPSGQVWKELVFDKWWTNTHTVSGEDGKATISGFLGQYKIIARDQTGQSEVNVDLKPGGTTIKIEMRESAAGKPSDK